MLECYDAVTAGLRAADTVKRSPHESPINHFHWCRAHCRGTRFISCTRRSSSPGISPKRSRWGEGQKGHRRGDAPRASRPAWSPSARANRRTSRSPRKRTYERPRPCSATQGPSLNRRCCFQDRHRARLAPPRAGPEAHPRRRGHSARDRTHRAFRRGRVVSRPDGRHSWRREPGRASAATFQTRDPDWKDANNILMLTHAVGLARAAGFVVVNVDAVVIAELPKLAPHIENIRDSLARAIGIDVRGQRERENQREGGRPRPQRGDCRFTPWHSLAVSLRAAVDQAEIVATTMAERPRMRHRSWGWGHTTTNK